MRPIRGVLSRSLVLPLVVGALLGLAACESDTPSSNSGSRTTGDVTVSVVEIGPGGPGTYTTTVAGTSAAVTTSAAREFTNLAAGSATVELSGVDAGCLLLGENPRTVEVRADGSAHVVFEVVCGGAIQIGSYSSGAASASAPRGAPSVNQLMVHFGNPDIFAGIVMTPDDVGQVFSVEADANADVEAIVTALTDGEITATPWGYNVPEFGSGSGTLRESNLIDYAGGADFQGATITSFGLRVDSYVSEPWGGSGWGIDIDYTMLIFGYPPTSATNLGSFSGDVSGTLAITTPDDPMGSFTLGLEIDETTTQVLGDVLNGLTFGPSDDEQAFVIGVNDDADFAALAARLADGIDDCVAFRVAVEGAINYGCVLESDFAQSGAGPDFEGATITGVRLVIEDFYLEDETPTSAANKEFYFSLDYRLEVIGIPAPAGL